MPQRQQRQQLLIRARKTRHVGVFQHVGSVLVIRVVGDGQAHFVQIGCPAHRGPKFGAFRTVRDHGVEQTQRGVAHAAGLVGIDVVTLHELAHGFVALVMFVVAAKQVIQHAQAQGAVAGVHDVDAQLVEERAHDGQAARQHVGTFDLDAGQLGRNDAAGAHDAVFQLGQARACDAPVGIAALGQDGEQRLGGAGRSVGFFPAHLAVLLGNDFDFAAGGQFGLFHLVGIHHAVREELAAVADATHVKR
ncbi:hypothetical protein D3C85_574100 [compost metagenome]